MNLTFGNTNLSDLCHKIKGGYVASAGGAVLAFSAIAGLSGAPNGNAGGQAGSVPQTSRISYAENSIVPIRVYVAENPEEAAAMEREQSRLLTWAASNGLPLPMLATIVVRGTALEQDLLSASGTVAASGQTVEVLASPAR